MNSNFNQITRVKYSSYDNTNEDEDTSYEDKNELDETFNDDNEEFVEFKDMVKEWITLDDDILKLRNAIKERTKRKNDITPKIMDFMNKFEINDLNTNNGKLKFTKSLQTKPLNKTFLISRLGDFFKDFSKGEKAATFILENRDKEEKFKLRRVINKKEFNL